MDKKYISASSIEKYGYCPLSWWLSRDKDEEPKDKNLEKGEKKHEKIGGALKDIQIKEKKLKIIENIILVLAISATVVSVLGLTFLYPDSTFSEIFKVLSLVWLLVATSFLFISESSRMDIEKTRIERTILIFAMVATIFTGFSLSLREGDNLLAWITQIISLSWLIGASYWLKHSLSLQSETMATREDLKVEEGDIEYVDTLEDDSRLLKSERYGIRGRPDYILEMDGDLIPVEVKTGRVPKGPFFSHILQIAAYCLLVEEDLGKKPPYGLIRYGETEFDIDYDESLKNLLIEKLDEMREHLDNKDVHRHHNRKGKCANCSRRKICPESLV